VAAEDDKQPQLTPQQAVFSTQTIPSSAPAVVTFKEAMERAVYAALA
jgi:hypothetical protein